MESTWKPKRSPPNRRFLRMVGFGVDMGLQFPQCIGPGRQTFLIKRKIDWPNGRATKRARILRVSEMPVNLGTHFTLNGPQQSREGCLLSHAWGERENIWFLTLKALQFLFLGVFVPPQNARVGGDTCGLFWSVKSFGHGSEVHRLAAGCRAEGQPAHRLRGLAGRVSTFLRPSNLFVIPFMC